MACTNLQPISGGNTSPVVRVDTPTERLVVKTASKPTNRFHVEADGLRAIAQTHTITTPTVILATDTTLVLEWIEPGTWSSTVFEQLGHALGLLHQQTADTFGYSQTGWIGSSIQRNTPHEQWSTFFVRERLAPQIEWLWSRLDSGTAQRVDALYDSIAQRLDALTVRPSLLHGDLWSGNVLCRADGVPVVIDPAVYYGHGEADIGMTELFGGFPSAFYSAYRELHPTDEDGPAIREIYNLYHVLNHANLFGSSYLEQAKRLMHRYTVS
ncbi:MAG: fructosamine kinase family protein [Myxococcota bacterium]|nr:fructosamine kinase family protein [Myxococcota bacterium]